MKHAVDVAGNEYGGAGIKLLLVLLVLVTAGNAGINYIPVAYSAESFKQEMQTAVVNGLAVPRGNPADSVKQRLQKAINDYELPPNTLVDVKQVGQTIHAHASYSTTVHVLPFGLYNYTYRFDHTAVPTGYLLKDSN